MEKRLNFNKEVDDLTKINEFFQNSHVPSKEEFIKHAHLPQTQKEPTKSA